MIYINKMHNIINVNIKIIKETKITILFKKYYIYK